MPSLGRSCADGQAGNQRRRRGVQHPTEGRNGSARDLEGPSRDRGAGLPGGAARRGLDRRAGLVPHPQPPHRPSGAPRLSSTPRPAKPVEREDQVKGYETDGGKHGDARAGGDRRRRCPRATRRCSVEAFIPCAEIDTLYFDRPYYLTPAERGAETAFAVIRDGLAQAQGGGAGAHRAVPPGAHPAGPRAGRRACRQHARVRPRGPRRRARRSTASRTRRSTRRCSTSPSHIIDTKRGKFDPAAFEDRYDEALAELVKAKAEGKPIPKPKPPSAAEPIDLMEALREQREGRASGRKRERRRRSAPRRRRKAG